MVSKQDTASGSESGVQPEVDAVIVGAGISGLYMLYRLLGLGLSVRVFEAGSGVGGTWYWNRYPGARFDSESYSYCYSFSEELLKEWDWKEHFSAQPETLRYLNFVADKFGLKDHITFNSKVASARYDDANTLWRVETEAGECVRARYLITAMGPLSAPMIPDIPGIDEFEGQSWHTSRWPADPDGYGGKDMGLAGKRVGIIGTGATGVQVIQEVAKIAGHLTVFQLVPEYCSPLGNRPIDEEEQRRIKNDYPEIFRKCRESFGSFLHDFDPRLTKDVAPEEREAFWEKLYHEPGFGIWFGNFKDSLSDPEANELLSEFVRKKIRERVKDPETAEKLVPKTYGFGTRRVPMENGYYEVYNQDNVTLVDLNETPIERITPAGIKTSAGEHDLDFIIFATGFDAVVGAFKRMDIRGENGLVLNDKWADGPKTYLGMQSAGFPNMFMLVGPHNGSTFCNIPRCIEQNVEWVSDLIKYMSSHGYRKIAALEESEEEWTSHVYEVASETLFPQSKTWFMGANVEGRKPTFLLYAGGSPRYREICDTVAAEGYSGFRIE